MEAQFFNSDSGCLMGHLALEVAGGTMPEFIPLVRAFFDEWINSLYHLFTNEYYLKISMPKPASQVLV